MSNRIGILLLLSLIFAHGCTTAAPTKPAGADLQKTQTAAPESSTAGSGEAIPAAGAASRVYRDPVTGEFTPPPPEAKVPTAPASIREAVRTEPAPATKETAVEGGGALIHLQGRFRSFLSATKDPEGKVTVHCNAKPHAELHEGRASEK